MTHAALKDLIRAAKRANGDHTAPHDCYATGPMTGDPIKDLVECPGCQLAEQIKRAESALSAMEGEAVAWELVTSRDGVVTGKHLSYYKPEVWEPDRNKKYRLDDATLRPLIYGDTAPPPQQAADRSALMAGLERESQEAWMLPPNTVVVEWEKVAALATQPQQAGGDAVAALPEYWRGLAILNDAVIAHVLRDVAKQLEAALSTTPASGGEHE